MTATGDKLKKVTIDLDFIMPDTTFIYPLYSQDDEKLLDEREVLTVSRIKSIKQKHGSKLYYYIPDDGRGAATDRVYRKALNSTKSVLDSVYATDKFTGDAYRKSEEIINELMEDLNSREITALHLLKDMRTYDEYLYNHSINVGILTALLAKKKRIYKEDELRRVVVGAYLCDVGKIRMDKSVLYKPDKLTEDEMIQMKLHPQMGYNILKVLEEVDPVVLQTILFHHERYDDEGYYNLPYDTLPSSPKIVSICDMYDALTSARPFRQEYSPSEALKVITNTIDKKYDRQLITDFINMSKGLLNNSQVFYRKGDFCMLNTGEISVITGFGTWDILQPQVIVFARYETGKEKTTLKFFPTPTEVDLAKDINRKMDGIVMHPGLIRAIKIRLKEKRMLLDYLYSSITDGE